jgi:hypothetical protein
VTRRLHVAPVDTSLVAATAAPRLGSVNSARSHPAVAAPAMDGSHDKLLGLTGKTLAGREHRSSSLSFIEGIRAMTHPRHWMNGTTAADETFREIEAEWEDASTFKYAKVDNVFIIEHFRMDEGFRFAYHAQYVARATSGQRYVVASLDEIIPDVLKAFPQKFGLLFRVENNYPKLAQGLKGEWPRGARIIVSHFPLSSRLHWLVCVPADERKGTTRPHLQRSSAI